MSATVDLDVERAILEMDSFVKQNKMPSAKTRKGRVMKKIEMALSSHIELHEIPTPPMSQGASQFAFQSQDATTEILLRQQSSSKPFQKTFGGKKSIPRSTEKTNKSLPTKTVVENIQTLQRRKSDRPKTPPVSGTVSERRKLNRAESDTLATLGSLGTPTETSQPSPPLRKNLQNPRLGPSFPKASNISGRKALPTRKLQPQSQDPLGSQFDDSFEAPKVAKKRSIGRKQKRESTPELSSSDEEISIVRRKSRTKPSERRSAEKSGDSTFKASGIPQSTKVFCPPPGDLNPPKPSLSELSRRSAEKSGDSTFKASDIPQSTKLQETTMGGMAAAVQSTRIQDTVNVTEFGALPQSTRNAKTLKTLAKTPLEKQPEKRKPINTEFNPKGVPQSTHIEKKMGEEMVVNLTRVKITPKVPVKNTLEMMETSDATVSLNTDLTEVTKIKHEEDSRIPLIVNKIDQMNEGLDDLKQNMMKTHSGITDVKSEVISVDQELKTIQMDVKNVHGDMRTFTQDVLSELNVVHQEMNSFKMDMKDVHGDVCHVKTEIENIGLKMELPNPEVKTPELEAKLEILSERTDKRISSLEEKVLTTESKLDQIIKMLTKMSEEQVRTLPVEFPKHVEMPKPDLGLARLAPQEEPEVDYSDNERVSYSPHPNEIQSTSNETIIPIEDQAGPTPEPKKKKRISRQPLPKDSKSSILELSSDSEIEDLFDDKPTEALVKPSAPSQGTVVQAKPMDIDTTSVSSQSIHDASLNLFDAQTQSQRPSSEQELEVDDFQIDEIAGASLSSTPSVSRRKYLPDLPFSSVRPTHIKGVHGQETSMDENQLQSTRLPATGTTSSQEFENEAKVLAQSTKLNAKTVKMPLKKVVITLSNASKDIKKLARKLATAKGALVANSTGPHVTHIVACGDSPGSRRCNRTFKYIMGIAMGVWVVTPEWLTASMGRESGFAQEDLYEVIGDNEQDSDPNIPRKSRLHMREGKPLLLEKYAVFCPPPYDLNLPKPSLYELLKLLGVTISESASSLKKNRLKVPIFLMLDTANINISDQKQNAQAIGVPVVSRDWILDCVLSFCQLRIEDYFL